MKMVNDITPQPLQDLTPEILFLIEPELKTIAAMAAEHSTGGELEWLRAYGAAKSCAWELIGNCAKNPLLRSCGAWDCFFDYVREELGI